MRRPSRTFLSLAGADLTVLFFLVIEIVLSGFGSASNAHFAGQLLRIVLLAAVLAIIWREAAQCAAAG